MTDEPRMEPRYLWMHRKTRQPGRHSLIVPAADVEQMFWRLGLWTELSLRNENAAWNDV